MGGRRIVGSSGRYIGFFSCWLVVEPTVGIRHAEDFPQDDAENNVRVDSRNVWDCHCFDGWLAVGADFDGLSVLGYNRVYQIYQHR